jgi:hypothetical protein
MGGSRSGTVRWAMRQRASRPSESSASSASRAVTMATACSEGYTGDKPHRLLPRTSRTRYSPICKT